MWRIILTSLLALALAGSSAWAEIERNTHSRSGSGVDEEVQDPQVDLIDLPAEPAMVAISLTARNAVAFAVTETVKRTAARLLMAAEATQLDNEPAAALPDDSAATESSAILETVEALENADAGIPSTGGHDAPDAAAPSLASTPAPEATAATPAVDEPAGTKPEPQPAVTLDDLAGAVSSRIKADQPEVVIDTEPVVDDQAALKSPDAEPVETPAEEAAGQPQAENTTLAEIEEQEPAADDTAALLNYDPANDKRRPDLTRSIKNYDGSETVSVNPSVDDQLLLAGEPAGEIEANLENDSENEASVEGSTEQVESSAGQAEEDGGTSGWVRAAPAGRARPTAPSRRWDRRHDVPKLHPPESEQPAEPFEIPQLEPDEPEQSAVDAGFADSEPVPAVALMDSPSLVRGLVLAPAADGDTNSRLSAIAPIEPLVNDWPPHMPDYKIADRIRTVTRGNSRQKKIALTFDDGPHPEFTSQLLAVLDYYDVKATFFCVGVQAQKYPHWVKMINQAGHEIGNHTYDHFRLPKMPRDEKIYQIDEYQRLIEGLTGVTPRFLRPPGGQVDAETEELLAERGMVLAMWDVALNDTHDEKTSEMILKTANRNIRAGSVVLVHDGIQATVDMLPALIMQLKAQGFEFVTMSELAAGL